MNLKLNSSPLLYKYYLYRCSVMPKNPFLYVERKKAERNETVKSMLIAKLSVIPFDRSQIFMWLKHAR